MDVIFFYSEEIKEHEIAYFFKLYGIPISAEFMKCANTQLSKDFETKTGLKINKHISTSFIEPNKFYYKTGEILSIPINIYVNHNWNPATVKWKSKSGRIYALNDTDIDCDDIEFWFEDLDVLLYHKQLYPKAELPFQLKNLTYELVVTRLNMDCSMDMIVRDECVDKTSELITEIDEFITKFNQHAEKSRKSDGVVHNWKRRIEGNKIIYEIDTGYAGVQFLKKMLPFLSKINCFSRIEIW